MDDTGHSNSPSQHTLEGSAVALQVTADKPACYTEMPVYKALESLLFTCTVGGLVFTRNFAATGIKRYLNASQVYSLLLLTCYAANVARFFTVFDNKETFGITLFLKMTHCVWLLETLGHYAASVIVCFNYKRLPEYFIEWEKIRPDCALTLNAIKRHANICAAILGSFLFINSILSTYLIFWSNVRDAYLAPWNREDKYVIVIQIINSIQTFYCSLSWFGPSALMFVICKILAYEFKAIQHRIKRLSQDQTDSCEDTLERLRRHHQYLCNLVANADDIFSMQNAISLSCSLVIACFLQYIIVYDDGPQSMEPLVVFTKGFWVCLCFNKVILDCVSGTSLNTAVRYFYWMGWMARTLVKVANEYAKSIYEFNK